MHVPPAHAVRGLRQNVDAHAAALSHIPAPHPSCGAVGANRRCRHGGSCGSGFEQASITRGAGARRCDCRQHENVPEWARQFGYTSHCRMSQSSGAAARRLRRRAGCRGARARRTEQEIMRCGAIHEAHFQLLGMCIDVGPWSIQVQIKEIGRDRPLNSTSWYASRAARQQFIAHEFGHSGNANCRSGLTGENVGSPASRSSGIFRIGRNS